jgi:hypothetical protein
MDSLKFHPGLPCSTFLLLKQPYGHFRGGKWPVALFYPLGHPMLYAYEFDLLFPPRDEIAGSGGRLCCQQQSMKLLWVNSGIRCIPKHMAWGVQRAPVCLADVKIFRREEAPL